MDGLVWILLLAILVAAGMLAPRWGGLARWRNWLKLRHRRQLEDALKHLLTLSQRGQSGSPESIAGALGLKDQELVSLISRMERRKLIQRTGGGLELTPEGERWAIQIVRAHRLWERYLSDEAGVPLENIHGAAERAEHSLSPEALEALDAHLGHPLHDPHGDPIPQADGTLEDLRATPLTGWHSEGKAHIVHLEDEPTLVFRQIVALGLQPGDQIRILEHQPDFIVIAHGDNEHRLAPVLAANIHVQAAALAPPKPVDAITLAELPDGREASVVAIDPNFRGFARRRLLDLGLTPETSIRPELGNAFGDPRAYRVRGVLIALREEQAKLVWVRLQEVGAA